MRILNKKAKFNYELFERIECGVELTGGEVKSAMNGGVNLENAFVRIREGEAFLINANIVPYKYATVEEKADRTRKLLLHKNEVEGLEQKMKTGRLTLVPTAIYVRGRRVKVEIALARGKRQYEKREAIKKRDEEREGRI